MDNDFTPRFNLSVHDRLTINNIAYRRRTRLAHGYVLERVDDADVVESFTDRELVAASSKEAFRFERAAFSQSKCFATSHSFDEFVASLPTEKEQKKILWRAEFCRELEKLLVAKKASLSDASLNRVGPEIVQRMHEVELRRSARRNADGEPIRLQAGDEQAGMPKAPSPRTQRKWRGWYIEGGQRAIALRHRRHINSGDRITQRMTVEERRLLLEFAHRYMSETRPSIRDVHGLMKAHIVQENAKRLVAGETQLRTPSYQRLAQEIRSFPEFDTYACRYGLDAAKRRFPAVLNGVDVERPMQRVEIDEWRVNLHTLCADAGILDKLSDKLRSELASARPWLCAALDCATRVCVGFKVGLTTTTDLAIDTLEMVVSPKAPYARAAGARSTDDFYGNPETVVSDQGAALMSLRFRRAIVDLGADPDAPPAGVPALRGRVERFFRTAGMQALCPYTGRSFESIAAKGDYDPVARISLTLPEFCNEMTRWILDIYHNSPHGGLGGETPANCWKRLVKKFGITPPPDRHTRRVVFGAQAERSLTPRGVRVVGLHFNSLELQELHRKMGGIQLHVRMDHMDLSHVSVRLRDGGWLAVPNTRPCFEDVSLDTWLAAQADLRRRFKAEAELADEIVAQAIKDAWALAEAAGKRASILSTRPSPEQLERAEEEIGIGFKRLAQLKPGATSINEDLMAGAIPTRNPVENAPAPNPPARAPRRFTIEE